MNREQAKRFLPIITAFAEGKTIQVKVIDGNHEESWQDQERPAFNDPNNYRIKPEPREFTIAYREDNGKVIGVAGFPGGAMIQVSPADVRLGMVKTMRVREVLD